MYYYHGNIAQFFCLIEENLASFTLVVHSAEGRYAQKLLNDLMENYSSALRPVEDTDSALNVTLQITLSQIKDMVSVHSRLRYAT